MRRVDAEFPVVLAGENRRQRVAAARRSGDRGLAFEKLGDLFRSGRRVLHEQIVPSPFH